MVKILKKWFYTNQRDGVELDLYVGKISGETAIEEYNYWQNKIDNL